MMKQMLLLSFVLVAAIASSAATDSMCRELGYVKDSLDCETCDRLEQAVSGFTDDDLKSCKSCCSEFGSQDTKYQSAILKIDTSKLQFYPELEKFVDNHAKTFKNNVQIQHAVGIMPQISLRDASNAQVEMIHIPAWKAEELVEFFEQHLV